MKSDVNFAGFFTHKMNGDYNNYCGLLKYVLNASVPAQTYLKYDGVTLLTFEPLTTHPPGVFTVNLEV